MADKASRALILYGDGLADSINPSHTHLHSLAHRAFCGFLSLPHSPPKETEDERIIRELAQLLDASEASAGTGEDIDELENYKNSGRRTISERFMGMRAAIISDNLSLKSFGGKLGCTVLQPSELNNNNGNDLTEQPVDVVASELLKLLGFQEGKTLETSPFDLVLLHIGAGENPYGKKDKTSSGEIEHVNDLVGEIMKVAQPESEIGSRLHLSVVMSYGGVSKEDGSCLSVLMDKTENNSNLALLFPRQSYKIKGGTQRKDVREHCPMLIAQWQDAVTRKDMAEMLSFKDFKENGGNLTIPADRFLHEVAFKLWKAPKYGA